MHSKTYITVRYAETDRMGIAHHSNYPVWYEVGRTDYIKLYGISVSEMEKAGVMMPLTNLTCHYKNPALYEDKIIIRTFKPCNLRKRMPELYEKIKATL